MRWILSSAVLLSLGSPAAVAQSTPASGWTPTLVVRPVPSYPEGERGSNVTGYLHLTKGEAAVGTIWSGRSLCSFGFMSGEPTAADVDAAVTQVGLGDASNVWKMSGHYLGEQNGRYQVRVTSGFLRIDGSASTSTVTQTLSLRDGDRVILDALREPGDSACPVRIATFEARLALQPTDPRLARAQYTADMWLVHSDPDGREQREHLVMNIDGSLVMPFMFNRLAFPIPQVDPRQGNAEAVIQLTGALRARPRADGLVDLDVETNRLLFGLEKPDGPIRSLPTTVRKTLTMKENETTAVDFPAPVSGYSAIALQKNDERITVRARKAGTEPATQTAGNDGPQEIVVVRNDRLVLFTDKFFRGHTTRLLITLKPLR